MSAFGTPSLSLAFFNAYHPVNTQLYTPPLFNTYALEQPNIFATTLLYYDDVKIAVPPDTYIIYQISLIIA